MLDMEEGVAEEGLPSVQQTAPWESDIKRYVGALRAKLGTIRSMKI